jgi:hypothetical protein
MRDVERRDGSVALLGENGDEDSLNKALAVVKAAGFHVSRPKTPKSKGRAGPVFEARFSDGVHVRLTVHASLTELDWNRGERVARQAWASRHKVPFDRNSAELAKIAPSIRACQFELDGTVLAQRNGGAVSWKFNRRRKGERR